MADHVDITLWIDRRWKDAIEKHLKDETLREHLEDVLDELCNQLPEQEYKRISAEIYAEDAAEREAREAARTYTAYHVTERRQEWYFKTSPGGSCWRPGKSYAVILQGAMVLHRTNLSECFSAGNPSRWKSTTRSLPFAWRTPARCAACSM